MNAFLLNLLARIAEVDVANDVAVRRTTRRIRDRYRLETKEELGSTAAYEIVRRARRRRDLAARLTASDRPVPGRGQVPRCAEYPGASPSYHATVYVNFVAQDGSRAGRSPVRVAFHDRLTAAQIIDLAVASATKANTSNTPIPNSPPAPGGSGQIWPTAQGATLGEVCYG